MTNAFSHRAASGSGPATDIAPVTPDDVTNLTQPAQALYVETGGTLSIVTLQGHSRTVQVADYSILPVGCRRINATGTSATGIHALVLA